jgi:hypothetical protein
MDDRITEKSHNDLVGQDPFVHTHLKVEVPVQATATIKVTESPWEGYFFEHRVCQSCGTQGTHVYRYDWRGQMLCEPCEQKSHKMCIDTEKDCFEDRNWNWEDPASMYHEWYIPHRFKENLSHAYHLRFKINTTGHLEIKVEHRCMCGKLLPLGYRMNICVSCLKKLRKRCRQCRHHSYIRSEELGEDFEDCGAKNVLERTPHCTDFMVHDIYPHDCYDYSDYWSDR